MNWQATQVVIFIGLCLITVVSVALTMTSLEYDPPGAVIAHGLATLTAFAATAYFAGLVFA